MGEALRGEKGFAESVETHGGPGPDDGQSKVVLLETHEPIAVRRRRDA